jgi:hypothetical protein
MRLDDGLDLGESSRAVELDAEARRLQRRQQVMR